MNEISNSILCSKFRELAIFHVCKCILNQVLIFMQVTFKCFFFNCCYFLQRFLQLIFSQLSRISQTCSTNFIRIDALSTIPKLINKYQLLTNIYYLCNLPKLENSVVVLHSTFSEYSRRRYKSHSTTKFCKKLFDTQMVCRIKAPLFFPNAFSIRRKTFSFFEKA